MKNLIIEIHRDRKEAKKILSRFQMIAFNRIHNTFYNYLRKSMSKYIVEQDDDSITCSNPVEDDKIKVEVAKLETFLLGDYKDCDIIMKEQGRTLRVLSKFMRLMKNNTVLNYFNMFGIMVSWRVEDEKEINVLVR